MPEKKSARVFYPRRVLRISRFWIRGCRVLEQFDNARAKNHVNSVFENEKRARC